MKSNEIKTEDIIKNLRACCTGIECAGCMFKTSPSCADHLMRLAADRLGQLSYRLDAIKAVNGILMALWPEEKIDCKEKTYAVGKEIE